MRLQPSTDVVHKSVQIFIFLIVSYLHIAGKFGVGNMPVNKSEDGILRWDRLVSLLFSRCWC